MTPLTNPPVQEAAEGALPPERSAAFLDWWHEHGRRLCITPECAEYVFEAGRSAALSAAPAEPAAAAEPIHWRAVLAEDQRAQQLQSNLHVVGFRDRKAGEDWVAAQFDFGGWQYTLEPLYAAAPAAGGVPAGWKHVANEWADMATNGLQALRNLKDGIGTVEEALMNMEQCLAHCRRVNDAAASPPSPPQPVAQEPVAWIAERTGRLYQADEVAANFPGDEDKRRAALAPLQRMVPQPVAQPLTDEQSQCLPNGLMFDALGAPRSRYVRVTLDGGHCIMRPSEGDTYLADAKANGDDSEYTVADVYLSEREFEDLPDFDGF